MASSLVELSYAYPFESSVDSGPGPARIRLATSGGTEAHPHFFEGRLTRPAQTAALLLVVSKVARSRFYVPPGMLDKILREADPVVTSDGRHLRFEAFSQCCGVYARGDLLQDAFEGGFLGRGTTNVDFNPPMRAALAQVGDDEEVGLNVGAEGVELTREAGSVVERKVRLPARWLKGFVEVQAFASGLRCVHEVPGPEARRFLTAIPAQVKARDRAFVVPSGRQLRISQRADKAALEVGGIGRLAFLKPLARRATGLRIYGEAASAVTGWELDLGDSRLQVLLSPEAARGFSGEGQVLAHIAGGQAGLALARVRAALTWQPRIEPAALAARAGVDLPAAEAALAVLGTRGLVGFDLRDQAYFRRELPFDLGAVEKLHPRVKGARRIVEAGGVQLTGENRETVEAYVRGSDVEHRVVLTASGYRCTCPWMSRHGGEAGPCKHVLAVQMTLEQAAADGRAA